MCWGQESTSPKIPESIRLCLSYLYNGSVGEVGLEWTGEGWTAKTKPCNLIFKRPRKLILENRNAKSWGWSNLGKILSSPAAVAWQR